MRVDAHLSAAPVSSYLLRDCVRRAHAGQHATSVANSARGRGRSRAGAAGLREHGRCDSSQQDRANVVHAGSCRLHHCRAARPGVACLPLASRQPAHSCASLCFKQLCFFSFLLPGVHVRCQRCQPRLEQTQRRGSFSPPRRFSTAPRSACCACRRARSCDVPMTVKAAKAANAASLQQGQFARIQA